MRFRTARRAEPAFNLTPLIDILFIVLIFLVLTTTFRDVSTLPVTLPTAASGDPAARTIPDLITIAIAEDGSLSFQGERVSLAELTARLAALERPEVATVRLRADEAVTHGRVVQVLDALRRRDINQLSIETRISTDER